jgi:Tfp pilus assembly protein PilF/LPS sulfotransferase NodH
MLKESNIKSLLKQAGKNLAAIDQIAAQLHQNRYPLNHVLQAYKDYLAYQPDSANAAFNYAYYLSKDARFETAINWYERSLELGISGPEEVHLNIANIYMDQLRDDTNAREHLQNALTKNPNFVGAYYNLGNLEEQAGNRDEAVRNFEQCLRIDPAYESALARLADTHRFTQVDDPLLLKLAVAVQKSSNSDLQFALGKACEQLKNYDKAWQHFSAGNALDKRALPIYNPKQIETVFQQIKTQCDHDWMAEFQGQSHEPVFICGMFRTGSTLLEQVLASHSAFDAGGESEFFPRLVAKEFSGYPAGLSNLEVAKLRSWQMAHKEHSNKLVGTSSRLTDKRPDNFLYIGLIKAILPGAKFVITERDWRDVATSIFGMRLGASQSYATTLENIRHYIGLQTQLVDHWQSILGPDLIRVRYEDMVSEPRDTIGALLQSLGEDWEENCLSFHKLNNPVQTASVWQVREPLHSKSIGRWRNYQKQFEKVFGPDVNF